MEKVTLKEIANWKKTKEGFEHSFNKKVLHIIKKFISTRPKYVIKNITDSTIIITHVK